MTPIAMHGPGPGHTGTGAQPSPSTVKCLVWDLDGTLWRGTLLEGDEVELPEAIREVVKGLDRRGVLQSIASRNDHDLAMARLEELGVAEYFVLPQIGWGSKSHAVRTVARRLGFAEAAMAFIDDHPENLAEVAFHLPKVRCYAAAQARTLLGLPEFSPAVVTADARARRAMYQAGFLRDAARAEFAGPDEDFLRSLDLRAHIARADEHDLTRVEELTLRTSQMNATGVHYPDGALRALLDDPGHEVLVAALSDRFGPQGAVGIVLLARRPGLWHLRLLATSCRVVAYGLGSVLLRWLIDQAAAAQVHLVADFRGTGRNRVMEVTYRFAGLAEQACACQEALEPANPGPGLDGGIRRLHLAPARQPPPTTMRVAGPDLRVPGAPGAPGTGMVGKEERP